MIVFYMKEKIYWPSFHHSNWFSFETNNDLIERANLCGKRGRHTHQVRICCISVGFNHLSLIVNWRGILLAQCFLIKHRYTGFRKAEKPNGSLENQVEFESHHYYTALCHLQWGLLSLRRRTAKKIRHTHEQRNGFYKCYSWIHLKLFLVSSAPFIVYLNFCYT